MATATLIDGYNLIFQCGLQGRRGGSSALEAARNRLISELTSRLDANTRSRTTIVFDAAVEPIKDVPHDQRINGMHVVFAVEYDEADALIEELIRKHSAPKNLVVVSSDHRIHKAALRRKANPIDSDIWFDRLETRKPGADTGQAESDLSVENQMRSELENVDWEKEFGLDNVAENSDHPDPKSTKSNPFPPGYGEDLLESEGEGS